MKSTSSLLIVVFTFLVLAAGANAQSPREQLQQMVEQLQKTPTDNALREKIIKLAAEIKPALALPEEAERRMARGEAAFERAKEPAEYANAVREFQAAATAAPWFATPYFNIGVAEEKADHPKEAMESFRWYLLAAPDAKDAAEVKKRLFKLEYAAEQQGQAVAVNAKQAAIKAQAKRFEGDWYWDAMSSRGDRAHLTLSLKHGADDVWRIEGSRFTKEHGVRDIQFFGSELRFKYDEAVRHPDRVEVTANIQVVATVTPDGNVLKLAHAPMPFTASQAKYWSEWSNYVPKPHVDEYQRQH